MAGIPESIAGSIGREAKEMVLANSELLAQVKEFLEGVLKAKYTKKCIPEVRRLCKKLGLSVAALMKFCIDGAGCLAQKDQLVQKIQISARQMAIAIQDLFISLNDVPTYIHRIEMEYAALKVEEGGANLAANLGPGSLALYKNMEQYITMMITIGKLNAISLPDSYLQASSVLACKAVQDAQESLVRSVEALTKNTGSKEAVETSIKKLNDAIASLLEQVTVADLVLECVDLLASSSTLLENIKKCTAIIDPKLQRMIVNAFRPLGDSLIALGEVCILPPPDKAGFGSSLSRVVEDVCLVADDSRDLMKGFIESPDFATTSADSRTVVKEALELFAQKIKSVINVNKALTKA